VSSGSTAATVTRTVRARTSCGDSAGGDRMNCHSQVKKDSEALLPIRQAFGENEPVALDARPRPAGLSLLQHMAHVMPRSAASRVTAGSIRW